MADSNRFLLTSESVTEGHPDKICDQVSDAILDAVLRDDPHPENARVAVETFVTTGTCLVAGEMTTQAWVDVEQLVRETVRQIGYTRAKFGFDYATIGVLTAIHAQSPDIAQGTSETAGGAGDQGMMFGYATDESPQYMPMPIVLAHRLAERLAAVRKTGELSYLRPDGKTQVTVLYEGERPLAVTKIVMAAQHSAEIDCLQIKGDLIEYVIKPIIPDVLLDDLAEKDILVNCTGRFVVGGPQGDTGLTGRKIIVDTYGGAARHGGGSFSGKDPTKVDRSGAYMMRYLAKNIVAAGLARRCELQVAYAIGYAQPLSVSAFCFGTENIPEAKIARIVEDNFDLSPRGMIDFLNLRRPIYQKTAAYGHFGRNDPDFTWEQLGSVDLLKQAGGA